MLLAVPFVRLLEAGLRFTFMRDHYGSYWDGLKNDLWFSDGWMAYVQTPLGFTMALLPPSLIACSVVCLVLAAIRLKRDAP